MLGDNRVLLVLKTLTVSTGRYFLRTFVCVWQGDTERVLHMCMPMCVQVWQHVSATVPSAHTWCQQLQHGYTHRLTCKYKQNQRNVAKPSTLSDRKHS